MIDFPIAEWLDDRSCLIWLERHLHPDGFTCAHCGSPKRWLFRHQSHFPAYRCRNCEGDYTLLTGTIFENTRQRPATLVLLLRGIATGEPTARLARELGLSRTQLHPLRQRIQTNLNASAPTGVMMGITFEADALYQHAGENSTPHRDPADTPQRRANKRRGHGTYANDRPPILSVVSRNTGEHRFWVCDHADTRTCAALIAAHIPARRTRFYTDAWQSDRGSHPRHATVRHGMGAWARDDKGDGRREVHGNTCEGAGAAPRTSLRAFQGVHPQDVPLDVATDEAMGNTTEVTSKLIRRMCIRPLAADTGYT
jgi:transposase-like protein